MLNRRSKLILLAVMWSGVAPAHQVRAVTDFIMIGAALKTFRIDAGRYPTESEGLMALVERPATYPPDRRWKQVMNKLPSDPWGNPYYYVVAPDLEDGYGLYSTGKDGVSYSKGNDPNDWNSWADDNRGRESFMKRLREFPPLLYLALGALVLGVLAVIRTRFAKKAHLLG